jgi:FkbM family methyltransferase
VKQDLRTGRLQPLWERVHAAALRGMNFNDWNPETNGELWLLDRLAARLGPSPVVFDVGANVGDYSQAVLDRMQGARVFAFEPSQAALAKFQDRLGTRATLNAFALGSERAERPLYADEPGSGLTSLVRRDLHRFGIDMLERETVAVRRLDEVCGELGVERIDLLKVDTEGGDLAVLRGAGAMLGECIGAIQFEYGGTALDTGEPLRDFFDMLEPAYRIHRLLPAGLRPLDYDVRLEIMLYANYVALPRTAA